ncbi:hypothetical protein ZIOFF_017885 [Zingiber officinale]|uniref:Uncharacterized protein n=1 Tax=Zingiber officinale TaxID=94328 RepID=A0A8J5H5P6_ZINOF|nr:hypothetical protein ZIOFF_017885 [Zingiber officinale]
MNNTSASQVPSPAATVRIFKLTREQLNLLKAKAPPGGSYIMYVLLTTHVWRCACIARDLPLDQTTKMYIPTETGEVASPEGGPSPAAKTTQEALVRMDASYLQSALDYMEMQPNLETLLRGTHTFRCPALNVNS